MSLETCEYWFGNDHMFSKRRKGRGRLSLGHSEHGGDKYRIVELENTVTESKLGGEELITAE